MVILYLRKFRPSTWPYTLSRPEYVEDIAMGEPESHRSKSVATGCRLVEVMNE